MLLMMIINVDIQACGGTRVGSLDAWEFYCDNDYQWFNKYHSNSLYIYIIL